MSKLPNADKAIIDSRKITDYLLSDAHARGQSKARFFTSHGFDRNSPAELAAALIEHAKTNEILNSQSSAHGMKYVIDGNLLAPSRRLITVRAVWLIDAGSDVPRFVTAYPGPRRNP